MYTAPVFRPDVWYPMVGFGMASFFCFTIFAISVWAKINGWLSFFLGLAGGALALTSGMYASRSTWLYDFLAWASGWHPVVGLVLAFGSLGLVCYLAVAAIPDRFAPAVSLSAGLAFGAFLLPSLALTGMPERGEVWVTAQQAVNDAGDALVRETSGWFW